MENDTAGDIDEASVDAWWHIQELDQRWMQLQENDMPKVSEMITSKFLRKEDIEEDVMVTIRGVKQENVGRDDAPESRWVIYYKEFPKGMVLNITSIRVLESAYGDDSDNWIGKQCILYVDPSVSFQGRVVGGLRIRPQKQKAKAPISTEPAEFNDDVPF